MSGVTNLHHDDLIEMAILMLTVSRGVPSRPENHGGLRGRPQLLARRMENIVARAPRRIWEGRRKGVCRNLKLVPAAHS